MTIGIPRALIYWKQPHFWEAFFEELGFKILLSSSTNKEIVEMGVKMADPETCFSQKVYWGHLLWLEGKCDFIFVPRLKAVAEHSFVEPKARREKKLVSATISHSRFARVTEEKLEYCPKFFGLPDLGKILVKTPILTENFDERKEKFEKTLERLGKKINKNKEEVKMARDAAFLKEKEFKEKEKQEFSLKIQSKKPKIVLISHPYNLYDDYVNLRMKEKLEKLGAQPIFIDEVPIKTYNLQLKNRASITELLKEAKVRKRMRSSFGYGSEVEEDSFFSTSAEASEGEEEDKVLFASYNLGWPKFHWEFGKEIMERIKKVLEYDIAGVIEISSFGCGCDAVIKEFVEKTFKQNKIPFLYLMIDEQAGEAGIQTRLEAFLDTLS